MHGFARRLKFAADSTWLDERARYDPIPFVIWQKQNCDVLLFCSFRWREPSGKLEKTKWPCKKGWFDQNALRNMDGHWVKSGRRAYDDESMDEEKGNVDEVGKKERASDVRSRCVPELKSER